MGQIVGQIVGQKATFKLKDIWALRVSARPTLAPLEALKPASQQAPRIALIVAVRQPIHIKRVRCSVCRACCSTVLMRTG